MAGFPGLIDTISDLQLHTEVVEALEACPDVHAEHIGVGVTAGAVTLAGEVAGAVEKAAALRAVTGIAGVSGVVDEIAIRGIASHRIRAAPPDVAVEADVARQAAAVLAAQHPSLSAGITVGVRDGKVVLAGSVRTYAQQQYLAQALRATVGADAVIDETTLRPAQSC